MFVGTSVLRYLIRFVDWNNLISGTTNIGEMQRPIMINGIVQKTEMFTASETGSWMRSLLYVEMFGISSLGTCTYS